MSCGSVIIAVLLTALAGWLPAVAAAAISRAEQARIEAADFGSFVQQQFIGPLRRRKIGGAVLVAVRDGQELYRISYGYRDVTRGVPVDVDHTMFVIASVSKTFTATAIAQLQSQGLLRYEDPVASRLKSFRLDSRFASQLRIRNLLTHTTGIPDLFLGASCRSALDCLPLDRFLAERQPEAHAPPGSFVSYSNFSNALAGQVVEDVSGLAYGDYLRERIFRPLGMRNTRYDVPGQPPADDAAAAQALGYELSGEGALVRSPSNYSMFYPAGQIAASAADMERYMIAHLDGGAFLPTKARLDMQRTHAHTPGFDDGYGWGWNSRRVGDVAVIGHGGDLRGVVTDLLLVPSERFGYFVAITGDAGPILENLSQAFKQRYLPPSAPPRAARATTGTVPAGLPGVYQDFRFTHDDPLQLLSVLSEARVRQEGDSGISVDLPELVGGGTYRFVAAGKDEFRVVAAPEGRPVTEGERLRVLRDASGAVQYFAFEDRGYDLTAEKMPPWRQTRFKLPGMVILLLGFVIAASLAGGALRKQRTAISRRLDAVALAALAVAALAALIFPLWVGMTLASASKWDLLYGLASLGLRPAYALLPVAAVSIGIAAIAGRVAKAWPPSLRRRYLAALLLGTGYLVLLGVNGQFARVY